jgi:hypothetical protein
MPLFRISFVVTFPDTGVFMSHIIVKRKICRATGTVTHT